MTHDELTQRGYHPVYTPNPDDACRFCIGYTTAGVCCSECPFQVEDYTEDDGTQTMVCWIWTKEEPTVEPAEVTT